MIHAIRKRKHLNSNDKLQNLSKKYFLMYIYNIKTLKKYIYIYYVFLNV